MHLFSEECFFEHNPYATPTLRKRATEMPDQPPLIMHITETAQGGVGRHLRDLLTGLSPSEFQQFAVTSRQRTPPGWAKDLNWPVRQIGMRRGLRPAADWLAYRRIVAVLREIRPALVHTHSSKAGFLARRAAWRLGIPVLYTPHVFAFQMEVSALWQRLFARLERRAAQWCDYIICVSETERQAALQWRLCPPEKLVLIRNGLEVEAYAADQPGRIYRADLGRAEDDELILAVGDLRTQKDYPTLLHAVALLWDFHPQLHCLIAGEGPERRKLERLIHRLKLGERVLLLGERGDIPALLSATDLFVMTSRYEGCPYALLETMAAGVPVVATRIAGIEEIIQPGLTGVLVPPGEPALLAAALDQVLSNPQLTQHRAQRAQEIVAERFTRERMLAEIAALYQRVLEQARS